MISVFDVIFDGFRILKRAEGSTSSLSYGSGAVGFLLTPALLAAMELTRSEHTPPFSRALFFAACVVAMFFAWCVYAVPRRRRNVGKWLGAARASSTDAGKFLLLVGWMAALFGLISASVKLPILCLALAAAMALPLPWPQRRQPGDGDRIVGALERAERALGFVSLSHSGLRQFNRGAALAVLMHLPPDAVRVLGVRAFDVSRWGSQTPDPGKDADFSALDRASALAAAQAHVLAMDDAPRLVAILIDELGPDGGGAIP